MAIWMDMTNSLYKWDGGVVGIVRAELEIAKNMRQYNPELRYVKYNGKDFVEIKPEEISWLWYCASIGDEYIRVMHRNPKPSPEAPRADKEDALYPALQQALDESPRKLKRFVLGCKHLGNTCPNFIRLPLKKVYTRAKSLRDKRTIKVQQAQQMQQQRTIEAVTSHPFSADDIVFSCGWMYSGKEHAFLRIKDKLPSLHIVYLIYDIILVKKETKQFYHTIGSNDFHHYLRWASYLCDALLFGGETAQIDTVAYQKEHGWPVRKGYPIQFGSDIVHAEMSGSENACREYLKRLGITGDYIIAVGSLDKRKNYSTLYRAYTILADRGCRQYPKLVIVGKGTALPDLCGMIQEDPRTKDNIILTSPTDEQLNWLYTNAKFSVLPSSYEGWSLTLPEALGYGKFTLASDVAPLREIGRDLIDYCDTYDPEEWADKILHYATHTQDLKEREKRIAREWRTITWAECSKQVNDALQDIDASLRKKTQPTLYFDLGMTALIAAIGGKITGILRTELMLLKTMYSLYPNIELFALHPSNGKYQKIRFSVVYDLITGSSLADDFDAIKAGLAQEVTPKSILPVEPKNTNSMATHVFRVKAFWYFVSCLPQSWQKKISSQRIKKKEKERFDAEPSNEPSGDTKNDLLGVPFQKGDVVFSPSSGISEKLFERFIKTKKRIGFKYAAIVYDYTPILVPQTHTMETKAFYPSFLRFMSVACDLILYGGRNAQKDGIRYQKEKKQRIPDSVPVFFGCDATKKRGKPDLEEDKKALEEMGIKRPFILAIGTIEPRKNYETLYRAYIRLLDQYGEEELPILAICGHAGWRSEELLFTLYMDERIKKNIILLEPTDKQLDCLYRHCEFSVLASLYEGWSLTLPESMSYGKFCLCCNTPALVEAAGDLAEYVDAFDEKTWCERIYHFHVCEGDRKAYEERIQKEWHSITWQECAEQVMDNLKKLMV